MINSPNFVGADNYTIDAKNRCSIPSKYRIAFLPKKEIFLTQGLEPCLYLYPASAWMKVNQKLETLHLKNKVEERAFRKIFYATACEVELDEEGRILIPQNLMEYAQLKREVAIIGNGERIEIWPKTGWEKYLRKHKKTFAHCASQLEI